MRELLNGDPVPDFDGNDAKEKHSVEQSLIRKAKRRASSKQHASCDPSEIQADTTQSKKRKTQLKVADAMESKEQKESLIRKAKRKMSSKKCIFRIGFQPIERVGRSALKDDTLIEDLLVLSSN
ncbi:unnamed protein product [Linum trigynum]|uniref:Uncharacterized protein n=1 Tax=Linum trigynum TaxID=586398 RepID=A0AAV2GVL3_9ROSI